MAQQDRRIRTLIALHHGHYIAMAQQDRRIRTLIALHHLGLRHGACTGPFAHAHETGSALLAAHSASGGGLTASLSAASRATLQRTACVLPIGLHRFGSQIGFQADLKEATAVIDAAA